jgi:PhnB protein
MTANLNPYLNFRGTAREAMTFYRSVFGGELTVSTFTEFGMPVAEGEGDLVMHSQLAGPNGLLLMAADIPAAMPWRAGENSFSISLTGDDVAVLTGWWTGLTAGATIAEPLEKAPWGDHFGMLTDRFGVSWLVNIAGGDAA